MMNQTRVLRTSQTPLVVGLPTTFEVERGNVPLDASYLERGGRIGDLQPRIMRHFFALYVRGIQADSESDDSVTYGVMDQERDEFPELQGVLSVTLDLTDDQSPVIVPTYGFGVFSENGRNHYVSLCRPQATAKEAHEFIAVMRSVVGFFSSEPWVASFANPLQKLEKASAEV